MGQIIGNLIRVDATQLVGGYPLIGQLDYKNDMQGEDGETSGPLKLYTARQTFRVERPTDLAYGEEKNRTVSFIANFRPHVARHFGNLVISFSINNKTILFTDRIHAIQNQGINVEYTFSLTNILDRNVGFDVEIGYSYSWDAYDTNPGGPLDKSAAIVLENTQVILNYQEINKFQPPVSTEAYIITDKGEKTGEVAFGPTSRVKIDWSDVGCPTGSKILGYNIFYTFNESGFDAEPTSFPFIYVSSQDLPTGIVMGNGSTIIEIKELGLDFDAIRGKNFWYGIQTVGNWKDDTTAEKDENLTSVFVSYPTELKANSLPSAPEISLGNTIITEVTIPSTGSGTVIATAGQDNDFQDYYVGLEGSNEWRSSPAIITLKDPGEYSFVTFDGLEQGPATKLTVIENIKPIANITNILITDLKQLSATGKEQNNKKITALQWYCRANSVENLLNSSESFKLGNEIHYETTEDLSFNYTFNPESGLKPSLGDYYQIGLSVKDNYEWSDISWFDEVFLMYGKIITDESSFKIQISNNYQKAVGEEFQNSYLNYFKASNEGIYLTAALPAVPDELEQLYYQLFYSINEGYSWIPYETKQLYKNAETVTRLIDASNIFNDVIFKIQITDLENNPTQIKESQSNKLYYAFIPQFPPSTILELNKVSYIDGRNNIRPNSIENTSTSWRISIPQSVCTLAGRNSDLKYSITLHYNSDSYLIVENKSCGDSEDTLFGELSFDIFKNIPLYGDTPIGPYDSYLTFTFIDVFDQKITSAQLNFVVDFREPPIAPNIITVGGSKLLDKMGNQFNNYNKEDWDKNNYYNSLIFMNYEHLIVIFNPSELSYKGQEVGFYSFVIKEKIDEENYKIIKNFKVSTSELFESQDFYVSTNTISSMKAAILPIGNIFNNTLKEYSIFISATDLLTYNGNSSKELAYDTLNKINGVDRILPTLAINNIVIEDKQKAEGSIVHNYGVVTISPSKMPISWISGYEESNFFSRTNKYNDNLVYSPKATLKLEFSSNNTFTEILHAQEIMSVTSNFSSINNFGEFTLESDALYNVNKIFIRGVLELTTGLKITDGEISHDIQTVYSNVIIYSGDSATVYYRKNGVGINSVPESEDILFINQLSNRINMRLFGNEVTPDGPLDHLLIFNVNTGTIAGQNFYLTGSLIPEDWIGKETDWEALTALNNLTSV